MPDYGELSDIGSNTFIGLHVKFPLVLSSFNESWIFSTHFRKILEYKISWKSLQWQSSFSMRTDGRVGDQTDITKLIFTSRNFTNGPKNVKRS